MRAETPGGAPRRSSFISDLRVLLAERDFRKLFATRLVSQAGDGVFNAGFAAYAFFSAQSFPNPVAAVYAFTVLYLPYSLIGPFAGVFIDRWSRRQIIVWGALIRAAMVAVAGFVVLAGQTGIPLYVSALAVLGVNRFFLSAISAGTPHVVQSDKLVMANAVAPTSGTILGFVGGVVGLGVHLVTGGGLAGSAATLWFGGACYVAAGLLGLRMSRDLLGPNRAGLEQRQEPTTSVASDLADVVRGLIGGLKHLGQRRKAAYALGAVGVHHALYGTLLVDGLLLYRNYFYHGGNGNTALGHATLLVITSAIGYGLAAVVTPQGVKWTSKDVWITAWLIIGGAVTITLGPTFDQIAFLALGFVMGLSAQCVKICVDTTVQQEVDDAYMGRVFALYDMLYNVAYVAGPAIAVPFLPDTGKSYPLVLAVGALYLAAGVAYAALTARATTEGGSPRALPTAATRPLPAPGRARPPRGAARAGSSRPSRPAARASGRAGT
jgi:MFS family permease